MIQKLCLCGGRVVGGRSGYFAGLNAGWEGYDHNKMHMAQE